MLAHLRGQTTFIMITHKIAMLDHVDVVLVVEGGAKKVTARFVDPKSTPSILQKRLFEE